MKLLPRYLAKHALHPPHVSVAPNPALGLVVAIPCHDEPDLLQTLADLWACRANRQNRTDLHHTQHSPAVEVLVAVNAAADAHPDVHARNRKTAQEARAWFADHPSPGLSGHVLEFPDLPPRRAGVGLARKLVMDEAVARFAHIDHPAGIIACLDADCRISGDYLHALTGHFAAHLKAPGAVLSFEHALDEVSDPRLRAGIVRYELHLRCMVLGLRWAGHPHAYHTVGSAMAVRADAYARQGGMNQRQAGEDFHFLSKFFPLPGFGVLEGGVLGSRIAEGSMVRPGVRVSHRVPFGTGRALQGWLAGDASEGNTYPAKSYRLLAPLFSVAKDLYGASAAELEDWLERQDPMLAQCLTDEGFLGKMDEIKANTASPKTFRDRFFNWMTRFRVMKMQHRFRDGGLDDRPSPEVAQDLLKWAGKTGTQALGAEPPPRDPEALLATLRNLERWLAAASSAPAAIASQKGGLHRDER